MALSTIIGSGDHSETFDVPGYVIRFLSTKKIEDSHSSNNSFWGVEYLRCNSPDRETDIGLSSTRNYQRIYYGRYETKYITQTDSNHHLYEAHIARSTAEYTSRYQKGSQICMTIYIPHEKKYKGVTHARMISNHLPIVFPEK